MNCGRRRVLPGATSRIFWCITSQTKTGGGGGMRCCGSRPVGAFRDGTRDMLLVIARWSVGGGGFRATSVGPTPSSRGGAKKRFGIKARARSGATERRRGDDHAAEREDEAWRRSCRRRSGRARFERRVVLRPAASGRSIERGRFRGNCAGGRRSEVAVA